VAGIFFERILIRETRVMARQVGKTTLLKQLAYKMDCPAVWLNAKHKKPSIISETLHSQKKSATPQY
jgi:hypothetical protein